MARIRTLKPEFWTDEKLSLLDPLTRLVFLGLVSLADDYGRLIDNVKLLDGQIFPHTDDSVLEPLETLAKLSRILRYRSKAGQQCIQIIGWTNHQKVSHKGKELIPAPSKEDYAQPVTGQPPIKPVRKSSGKSPASVTQPSGPDLGPRTLDLGPTTRRKRRGNLKSEYSPTYDFWVLKRGYVSTKAFNQVMDPFYPDGIPRFSDAQLRGAVEVFADAASGARDMDKWQIWQFGNNLPRLVELGQMEAQLPDGTFTERGEYIMRSAA